MPQSFEHHGDTNYVVAPMPAANRMRLVQIILNVFAEILGKDLELPLTEWSEVDPRRKINRDGHYKTVVVISVFTYEVYAARRSEKAGTYVAQWLL